MRIKTFIKQITVPVAFIIRNSFIVQLAIKYFLDSVKGRLTTLHYCCTAYQQVTDQLLGTSKLPNILLRERDHVIAHVESL